MLPPRFLEIIRKENTKMGGIQKNTFNKKRNYHNMKIFRNFANYLIAAFGRLYLTTKIIQKTNKNFNHIVDTFQ